MPDPISDLRKDYVTGALDSGDLAADPFAQFETWFRDARESGLVHEPNAMTLSTAGANGSVCSRVVLLKGLSAGGFQFFTNYGSRKSRQIAENSRVALSFYWARLERQAIICGTAAKLPHADSAAYFRTRPRASQLGAWASEQSTPVASRAELDARFAAVEERFAGRDVEMPPFWGGFLVSPETFEFWQGRTGRLHDRFLYRRTLPTDASWSICRLCP